MPASRGVASSLLVTPQSSPSDLAQLSHELLQPLQHLRPQRRLRVPLKARLLRRAAAACSARVAGSCKASEPRANTMRPLRAQLQPVAGCERRKQGGRRAPTADRDGHFQVIAV